MGAKGAKLRTAAGPLGHKRLMHWCPGCDEVHGYQIEGPDGPKWTFNGDYDRPTFQPSMRIFTREKDGRETTECHYFVTDGRIQFCGDSPHKLSGQTVELPDWPYAPGTFGGIEE